MFNPYVLLGALVFLIAACGSSYLMGSRHATNAARAAHAVALEDSIKQARQTAIEDMQIEIEAEDKRQKARVEFRDKIVTVERLIREKPSPAECVIPDGAVGVLRDAINRANGAAPAAEPKPVPPAAPTRQRPTGHYHAGLRVYD